MPLDKIYRRNLDVVARQILGETLLAPIRGDLADLRMIFALNPVAEHIWSQLDGERDLAAVLGSVVSRFTVTPAQAEADLAEFVAQLISADLIIEAA